jgi:hypothetical protein
MNDDEIARRKNLTFAEAEGLAPLPVQLQRTEISQELRAVLWQFIYSQIKRQTSSGSFETYVAGTWKPILEAVHVLHFHRMADEFSAGLSDILPSVKRVFEEGSYADIYGWLQFVLRKSPPSDFAKNLEIRLAYCRSPFRIVGGDVLYPLASDADARTVQQAFTDLKGSSLGGGYEHLRQAAEELTDGNFAGAIRESMHAVESVVRVLEPDGDFSKALAKLEAKTSIHGALKRGFTAIYGFTSDEQGIRHPLLEKEAPDVDEADALFMIGACSAFISYLINKSRAIGLLA